jgi:hypothetical protein
MTRTINGDVYECLLVDPVGVTTDATAEVVAEEALTHVNLIFSHLIVALRMGGTEIRMAFPGPDGRLWQYRVEAK